MFNEEDSMPVSDDKVYDAIRNEAVQRVNICYGKYNVVITAFGVLAVAGIQFHQPAALLLYPALALSLALSWHHNSLIVKKINGMLNKLSPTREKELSAVSLWESFFDYSNRVIFGVTSLASILLGIIVFPEILKLTWGLWIPIILALGAFVPIIPEWP
jgi:hypothetical protein